MSSKIKERLNQIYLFVLLSLINSEIGFCNDFNRSGCYGTDEVCNKCSCSVGSTVVVNCSYRKLIEIPHLLPWNLTGLDLSKNIIRSLNKNSFENCFNLYYLNLSTNDVSYIHPSSFRDTPITHLHLEENKLRLLNFTNINILSSLNNTLMKLFIYKNHEISHQVFNNLNKLEELHLNGMLIDGFGKSFSTLQNLKILRMYPKMWIITNLTFMYFENITTLTKLSLEGARVHMVEKDAFTPLRALRFLDFSNNDVIGFYFMEKFLNSLSDNLEELVLTNVIVKPNIGNVEIRESFFKILSTKKRLKRLKLDKNRIDDIPNNFTTYVQSLNYLDISKNRLRNVTFWPLYLFFLQNITKINLDDQKKDPRPCDCLQEPLITNCYENPCKAVAIKDTPPCTFPKHNKRGLWCGICPKNLKEFHFSNFIKNKNLNLSPVIIFGKCQITGYFFRNNGLVNALGPVVIFRPVSDQLVTIDLGNNDMRCFASEILRFSIERGLTVGRLILDGNNLSQQLECDDDGVTFAIYKNLTELNIANNRLSILSKLAFYNLSNLRILNLSSNFLKFVTFDMSQLKNLKSLDLRNNVIISFESYALLALSSLSSEKGYGWLTLYIEDNFFTCSCDSINFLEWIIKNDTHIDNLDRVNLLCNGAQRGLKDLSWLMNSVKMSCYYEYKIIGLGSLLALMIISIAVVMIVLKYRWTIRYYLTKHSLKKKQYQLFLNKSHEFVYDAFVSYEMNDRSWIVQELIMNLEKECSYIRASSTAANQDTFGSEEPLNSPEIGEEKCLLKMETDEDVVTFTLCIHERDFELGNRIEENIVNAIQMSRMVILVVSNHFIKSKWCRLELEMAKMESLERGRNIVLTVLLEPIQETLESLEWFMKQYTYLEWFKCDSENKKLKFWKRMKVALGK